MTQQIVELSATKLVDVGYHSLRVVSVKALESFWILHADSEGTLRAWFDNAEQASWKNPNDIKSSYGNASVIGNHRVVFNIKGNDYRLIVAVSYAAQVVLVKFVGTQ